MDKVKVTPGVFEGLHAVKNSAAANMGNITGVHDWLWVHGYPEAATWVVQNQATYAHGIFVGFEAQP